MLKGGYKQKIRTLSENNKALVEALEHYRYLCSEKEKQLIQVSTTALQNSISAKVKLSKLAKDLKQFLSSVEEIISTINTTSSAYPTMFVPNTKSKIPHDCLSIGIETISEETLSNQDELGEKGSFMEKRCTNSSSLIPTKRLRKSKKVNQKKISSISLQKQSRDIVLETSDATPNTTIISKRCSKRSKILAQPLKLQADKDGHKSEANIKVASLDEGVKCFKESSVCENFDQSERILQERGEQSQNKQILGSIENILSDKPMKTTVTAEIHKPPSDKLVEKKTYSSNIALMQPCVVLTDIRETPLLIESMEVDCLVETPSLKVQSKEPTAKKTKLNFTDGKNYKKEGSLASHPKSSRLCRNRPAISYKEISLNTKLRRN